MPTINFTKARPAEGNDHYTVATWAALASGDDGAPIRYAHLADRSVQVSGMFDGGTLVVEGSINGVDYHTLTDPQGNALSFSVGGLEAVTEAVAYIRPRVTGGGASTAIDVALLMRD